MLGMEVKGESKTERQFNAAVKVIQSLPKNGDNKKYNIEINYYFYFVCTVNDKRHSSYVTY